MRRNLQHFQVRDIPFTEAKEILVDFNRPKVMEFIIMNFDQFVAGYPAGQCIKNGVEFLKCKRNTFTIELHKYCEKKQFRSMNKNKRCYYIKEKYKDMIQAKHLMEIEEQT